jgi:CubicO group peptidase (beta-lactamase class C family)
MTLRNRLSFSFLALCAASAGAVAQDSPGQQPQPTLIQLPQAPGQAAPTPPEPSAEQLELARLIQRARDAANMPGIAGAIVRADGTVTTAVFGARELGKPDVVRLDDPWHLGSCGKAMTATVIAMVIEAYQGVTLEQLLTGRGGVPPKLDAKVYDALAAFQGTVLEGREMVARAVLTQSPQATPGSEYLYSNLAWVIAGVMTERAAMQPFETVMRKRLFEPLEMKTAGFGAPGNGGPLPTEPRGHTAARIPVPPSPKADSLPAFSPTGTVHCSMADWAKFLAFQLRGAAGTDTTLSKESWAKLLNPPAPPPAQDYAMGWVVRPREWAGGVALTHDGSNTMWYSVAWMAPRKGFAVMVATNIGGEQFGLAINRAAWDVIQDYLRKTEGREPTSGGR